MGDRLQNNISLAGVLENGDTKGVALEGVCPDGGALENGRVEEGASVGPSSKALVLEDGHLDGVALGDGRLEESRANPEAGFGNSTKSSLSRPRVLVGMSGGVDSSVAAALLVEAGYDVCGAYMKNWILDVPGMRCPWADDLADAKRTAVRLGIDFRVYDFQEAYKREVVDYLVSEYRAGRTPNPDIMCNQEVKFGLFLDAALQEGFDWIATGHYARAVNGCLLRGADEHKDQTYFLYRISQRALDRTLFPLGEFTKPQVRAMAEERALPSADKADSQGICFVGEAGIREFLSLYVQPKPGPTIDVETGQVVGHHDGAIYFTIGQRKGLGIGGGTAPYYVVSKDMERNEVYVSTNLNAVTQKKDTMQLARLNWISGEVPAPGTYLVRTRHTGPLVEAHVKCAGDEALLEFSQPCNLVAPGQSAVLYDGLRCLGGGIVV